MTAPEDPTLGEHDLDLPYEPVPDGPLHTGEGFHIAGGLVVAAATVPVPDVGVMPALRFTFVAPDGTHYPPFLLVSDVDQMTKLKPLVYKAANAAIAAARKGQP